MICWELPVIAVLLMSNCRLKKEKKYFRDNISLYYLGLLPNVRETEINVDYASLYFLKQTSSRIFVSLFSVHSECFSSLTKTTNRQKLI